MRRSELATVVERSTRTLAVWAERGYGPVPIQVGGRWFYKREAVAEWLQDLEEQADLDHWDRSATVDTSDVA